MKITKTNYISSIEKAGINNLPEEIQQAHLYIMKMTDEGKDWSRLTTNPSFKSIAELAFEKLGEFLKHNKGLDGVNDPPYIRQAKEDAKNYQWQDTERLKMIYRMEIDAEIEGDATPEESKIRKAALEKELKKRDKKWLDMMKSNTSLEGKTKKCGVGLFDTDLKDYFPDTVLPKEKSKLDEVLKICFDLAAIIKLQKMTIGDYNEFWYEFGFNEAFGRISDGYIRLEQMEWYYIPLKPLICEFENRYDLNKYEFQIITNPEEDAEKPFPKKYTESKIKFDDRQTERVKNPVTYFSEVYFIEKFLALDKQRVKLDELHSFIKEIHKSIVSLEIRKTSPYSKAIEKIQDILVKTYNTNASESYLRINLNTELKNYLKKMLTKAKKDFSFKHERKPRKVNKMGLSGIETPTIPEVITSTALAEKEFTTIGFTGKWLDLMGDPCAGFTAMVFGKPKMGKSYLSVDFAGYLAKNFGKVLYVAKEEKFGVTFAKKLEDKNAMHENLVISDDIPEDLSPYNFVFLDSTNSLNLTPEDLRKLKEKNPCKSFVFIFQTTKTGNFRGENTFQHDVDIVIEIPERGKAIQFGRFNQGGEMQIFEDSEQSKSEETLSGTKRKDKNRNPVLTNEYFKQMTTKQEDL